MLVDCNNFYVSCERLFNPKLENKPVIVLSNNDGIVVARSNETKAIGVPMGSPVFKIRHLINKYNINIFSSNYALYADMSQRVMNTLATFTPSIEIYSIDEAFLSLDHTIHHNPEALGHTIRTTVHRWTGIPVSIGIGPTKTLAKIANTTAKRESKYSGVCNSMEAANRESYLKSIPVSDIWGIGRRYSVKLQHHSIRTAYDLAHTPRTWVQKHLTIAGVRTHMELNGTSCIALEDVPKPRAMITSSRSFGKPISSKQTLEEAISSYTAQAAEKLRRDGSIASVIHVYITTSRFHQKRQYSKVAATKIHPPTAYTPHMITHAQKLLSGIYKSGYDYKKAGVILSGIQPARTMQIHMLQPYTPKQQNIMDSLDEINARWGRGTISTAAEGLHKPWGMKRNILSQRFSTSIQELLTITI